MSSIQFTNLVSLDKKSVNLSKFEDIIFDIYSLPSYDKNKSPEKKNKNEIKNINNLVSSNTVLFNKLNVRFKRIWNIYEVNKNSLCSGEFLRLKPKGCYQNFLYYFLQTEALTNYLINASGGSSGSHSRISPKDLMDLKVTFPDFISQQKIASVLSTLDSKIELNNKINSELEAMARTLYDYWFVQFDFPNENGKPYKSSDGKMVNNEELKREIPGGWEVKNLASLISESKNGDWGNAVETKDDIKCFCIRGADINGLNGVENFDPPIRYITNSHIDRHLKADDLIVEISGGSPIQSTGRMAHISQEVLQRLENNVVCSNFCKAISLKEDRLSYIVNRYWNLLYESNIFFNYEGKTSGIKNLLFDQLSKDVKIVLPKNKKLVDSYYSIEETFDKQKQNNLLQNQKLAEIRDWLLPMLMNGQVTVN